MTALIRAIDGGIALARGQTHKNLSQETPHSRHLPELPFPPPFTHDSSADSSRILYHQRIKHKKCLPRKARRLPSAARP